MCVQRVLYESERVDDKGTCVVVIFQNGDVHLENYHTDIANCYVRWLRPVTGTSCVICGTELKIIYSKYMKVFVKAAVGMSFCITALPNAMFI
jgi:hypothetical protein